MRDITFQSIFDTPSVKQANLNTVARTPDGRIWEYLYATEAITKHMIVTRPTVTSIDLVVSSNNAAGKAVVITPNTSPSWTVGEIQDHWLLVNSGTGVGQVGKIRDNNVTSLELYENYLLATALTVAGTSDIEIVHEPDAEKSPATNEYTPLQGVAQVTFAAYDYGWFLTRGIGGVLIDTSGGTEHYMVAPGGAAEGMGLIQVAGDTLEEAAYVGRIISPADTAEKASLVDVHII